MPTLTFMLFIQRGKKIIKFKQTLSDIYAEREKNTIPYVLEGLGIKPGRCSFRLNGKNVPFREEDTTAVKDGDTLTVVKHDNPEYRYLHWLRTGEVRKESFYEELTSSAKKEIKQLEEAAPLPDFAEYEKQKDKEGYDQEYESLIKTLIRAKTKPPASHKYLFVAPYQLIKKERLTEHSSMENYVSQLFSSIEEAEKELDRVVGSTGYTDFDYFGYSDEDYKIGEAEWERRKMEAGSPVKISSFMASDYLENLEEEYMDMEFQVGIYAVKV